MMMRSKFSAKPWAWTLVGLLTLALAACSGENTPPDTGYAEGTDGGEQDCSVICSTDADCCAGLSCLDGVCSAGDACPSGCNYECDKASNQVCMPELLTLET
jgi:hypothetical protein